MCTTIEINDWRPRKDYGMGKWVWLTFLLFTKIGLVEPSRICSSTLSFFISSLYVSIRNRIPNSNLRIAKDEWSQSIERFCDERFNFPKSKMTVNDFRLPDFCQFEPINNMMKQFLYLGTGQTFSIVIGQRLQNNVTICSHW